MTTEVEIILSGRKSSPLVAKAPVAQERFERLTHGACETLTVGKPMLRVPVGPLDAHSTVVAPQAFEIDRIDLLTRENFGPLAHIVRFAGDKLDAVIDAVAATKRTLSVNTTAAGGNASLISFEDED